MYAPLRICRVCGLEAHSKEDLELFMKGRHSLHGRDSLCKKCSAAKTKLRLRHG